MKTPSSIYIRSSIALGSMAAYAIIFLLLYHSTGEATAALIVIPMAIVGWLLGVRGSLLFGVFIVPLHLVLFRLIGDPNRILIIPSILGSVAFTLVGVIIGWVRELLDRLNQQAKELQGERQILREERQLLHEEIEKRIKAEELLSHEALHDPLTNLANRRLFFDRLDHALKRSKRNSADRFALLYLDFDRFKVVNDSLGHNIGDHLLLLLAQRLIIVFREVDLVARMGGDEFAILLEGFNNNEEVLMIVKRLQDSMDTAFKVHGNSIVMTASIGIVLDLFHYEQLEDIMRDADIAMYSAKVSGRNHFKVFDASMWMQADGALKLESGLRQAIEKSEFRIHYQPIVSLKTHQITGFEALLRWEHPERGLLYPGDFIKAAEETGLIVPIGRWVLYEACHQMRDWQMQFNMEPPLTISINLSSRQFAQSNLAQQIEVVLKETSLPARSLLLELTETILIDDIETAIVKIEQLRALDVGVAIDDFGTGYSSLGYLRRLPVNHLKIDRSFVSTLGVGKSGIPIIRAIIAMANSLEMMIIAEGIETEDQMNHLIQLECDYGQGYLFNKPMDGDAAQKLISETFSRESI